MWPMIFERLDNLQELCLVHERLLLDADGVGVDTGVAVPEKLGRPEPAPAPPADMTGGASASEAGRDVTDCDGGTTGI